MGNCSRLSRSAAQRCKKPTWRMTVKAEVILKLALIGLSPASSTMRKESRFKTFRNTFRANSRTFRTCS